MATTATTTTTTTPDIQQLQQLLILGETFRRAVNQPHALPATRAAKAVPGELRTYVVDRRGAKVPVRFDLITERNEDLRGNSEYGAELAAIDSSAVTARVIQYFRNGMTTRELDAETASICIQLSTRHSDYDWLAARIHVSDLHKRTPAGLIEMADAIVAAAPNRDSVRLSDEFIAIARRGAAQIAARLDVNRDYRFRYFGYQTISRSYLVRPTSRREESTLLDMQLMERPQHLYMRVALGVFVCQPDGRGHEAPEEVFEKRLAEAFEFYDALSLQCVSNATPTMLNASTCIPQLSSCFQIATADDLYSLYWSLLVIAMTSKASGGVSLWLHSVRAENAPIKKTGGRSSGIKKYIVVVDDTQEYVDQGGNRRGAFVVVLEVHHDDIFTFLALPRLKSDADVVLAGITAPHLKYALWIPDLFMEALWAQIENEARVAAGGVNDPTAGDWYLFSPDVAPGLHLVYGEAHRRLYAQYVAEKRYRRRVKAGDIIKAAHKTWAQTGIPYVMFKDHVNQKANMRNVAPICSSNLCCEITIPSWSDFDAPEFSKFHPGNDPKRGEFGVCNLAAICLESYLATEVDSGGPAVEAASGSAADGPGGDAGSGAATPASEEADSGDPASAGASDADSEDASGASSGDDSGDDPPEASRLDRARVKELVNPGEIRARDFYEGQAATRAAPDGKRAPGALPPGGELEDVVAAGSPGGVGAPHVTGAVGQVHATTPQPRGGHLGLRIGEMERPASFDGVVTLEPPRAGTDGALRLDFAGIMAAAALEVRVLNRVIDQNYYPSEECRRSNRRHRPIGIGIMGLADVLARLKIAYGSAEAQGVARAIAAAVYFGAAQESARLAETEGPYESFAGSPISEGKLQPDLWVEAGHLEPGWEAEIERLTGGIIAAKDWAGLRESVKRGVRNAYWTAYMPTATTSNVVGQNECFEPFTSNIYTRGTLAGEFYIVNRHLMAELTELGLWDEQMRRDIIAAGGSVQAIGRIPDDIRRRYRTAREIHPSLTIRMAKAMAPFICQSMSMNLFLDGPDLPKILRFLFEGWRAGLKTGCYYIHTKPAAGSQKTSVRDTTASVVPAAAATSLTTAIPPSATFAVAPTCKPGCDSCGV